MAGNLSLHAKGTCVALAWTETVTRITDTHAPDDVYEALRPHFGEKEIADLTILIGMINFWNRLAFGLRQKPRLRLERPQSSALR
jgi:alkylhydroperoxidase family enzyme